MNEITKKPRRKQFIIDKMFQYKYLLTWFGMAILFGAVIAGIIAIGLSIFKDAIPMGWKETVFMVHLDVILIGVISVLFGVYLIWLSHRIAGPAFRLEKSVQRIVAGDYDFAIQLRKKDYLKHVADDLNELIAKLKARERLTKMFVSEVKYMIFVLNEQENLSPNIRDLMTKIDSYIVDILGEKDGVLAEVRVVEKA